MSTEHSNRCKKLGLDKKQDDDLEPCTGSCMEVMRYMANYAGRTVAVPAHLIEDLVDSIEE